MKFILLLLFPLSVVASSQPLTLTEQNFTLAWGFYADLVAQCLESPDSACGLSEAQTARLGELHELLLNEAAQPLRFASRKRHPELFPPRVGWSGEIATGAAPGADILIDTDAGAASVYHSIELLTQAFAQHLLSVHPDIDPADFTALGSLLAATANHRSVLSAADFVNQPRVRLALWLGPGPQFEILDDVSSVDLKPQTLAALGCNSEQPNQFSVSGWDWQAPAWNTALHTQPLEVSTQVQFQCAGYAKSGQLTIHFEFTPTFNGVTINRPDWQMVRGVSLRYSPSNTLRISFKEAQ